MAVPTLITTQQRGPSFGTGAATVSWTPGAGKTYAIVANWEENGTTTQVTANGSISAGSSNLANGPTAVNDTGVLQEWSIGHRIWTCRATGSPSGTTTFSVVDDNAQNVYQWWLFVVEITTTADYADLVVQFGEQTGSGLDSAGTSYNMAGATTSGNPVLAVHTVDDGQGSWSIMATPSGWTELVERSPETRVQIIGRDDHAAATIPVSQASGSWGVWCSTAIEFAAESTGAVDLVPSDSVVTVVSDTGSVTQTHVLTPTDAVVTVVSDGGSITQTHALVGTDAVVAVVNDTGSITQTHALTGTDSVVTVVSDAGSITAGVQINPTDSVVTIVADTSSITQTHQIVGTDSHVVVVSDGGTTTVGADIVGIDSVITIVSDTGAITQTHALAPTDSVVIVVSDTGTIIAEGDSLIQMRAGELTARWNATPLDSRWEAAELTTRWGASPLTE